MINWKQYPFVRLLIALCIGIFISVYLVPSFHFPPLFLILIFILTFVILLYSNRLINYRYRWINGLIISIFIIITGINLSWHNNDLNDEITKKIDVKKKSFYRLLITEPIEIKENSVKAIADIEYSKKTDKWEKSKGKTIIYFEKDTFSSKLKYGDNILVFGMVNRIKPPQNPDEFNYQRYLSNKNIHFQIYLKTKYVRKLNTQNVNRIKDFAISLREKLLKIFEENGMNGREYAVISAILLGQTDKIDPELYKAYSGSGALHVLSVSGMHVGIIFLSLTIFLSFLDKIKKGKILKALLLLVAVWFYAMLTGLSPSVIRASTMISFIIIGKALKRDAHIVNILSASGFVILWYNPYLLLEVGFQLSFLAVLGIVLFHETLYKLWLPDNKLLDKLWSVTCISIAAQIITTPISLYYFHQFPNYFLLTNIIVFVFAGVVMYAGIFVILVSFIPYLSTISAKILIYLIFAMNESISFIEGLPMAVYRGINFSFTDTLLLYIILLSVFYGIIYKRKKLIFTTLICIIILELLSTFNHFKIKNQSKIIVYAVSKTSAIEFIDSNQQLMFADSSLINNNNKIGFHIQNFHIKNGIKTNNAIPINENFYRKDISVYKQEMLISFCNIKIAYIDKAIKYKTLNTKISLDYLILAKNCKTEIKDLIKVFNPKKIIFDSSNQLWKTEKWEADCKKFNIAFYNVLKNGAYEINLKI